MMNTFIFLNQQNINDFYNFVYQNAFDNNYFSQSTPWKFRQLLDLLDIKPNNSFLLQNARQSIGVFLGSIRGRQAYISLIMVHKDFRGKGLGRVLLQKGLTLFLEHHCTSVTLEVFKNNEAALNLYLSEGFDIVHEIHSFRNENNSFFTKQIPREIEIIVNQSEHFQLFYRNFNPDQNKKPWSKKLRPLLKILTHSNSQVYIIRQNKTIIGYLAVTRQDYLLEINDIFLKEKDLDTFSYVISSLLEHEKIVVSKFFYPEDPMYALFVKSGFFVENEQYELAKLLL